MEFKHENGLDAESAHTFDFDEITYGENSGLDLLELATKKINPNIYRGVKRGTIEQSFTIGEGAVLLYGDLHLSSKYEGKHIDYMGNCIRVMSMIMKQVSLERAKNGISAVIFLGDVFGVKERHLNDPAFKTLAIQFFQVLNNFSDNNVYSVRGNHDFGDYPEFNQFEQLGLIKNPDFIDYRPHGNDQIRFHIMNYGDEKKDLNLIKNEDGKEDASDVVLAHNDFYVDGVTTWYAHGDKIINLATMRNFVGVDLLVVGHIHNPSPETHFVNVFDKHQVMLEYPGCPTRVSQRYDDCFYMRFFAGEGNASTEVNKIDFGLWEAKYEFIAERNDERIIHVTGDELDRRERLEGVMSMVREEQLFSGDPRNQIMSFPEVSDEVKALAAEYYDRATESI